MENRKRQYSRMVIQQAFLKELRQKPLEKISIVDLCREANVNRSTFYANYLDIYDLMDTVTLRFSQELFQQCVAELGEPKPEGKAGSIRRITHALNATLEQKELCGLLLSAPHRSTFLRQYLDTLVEWSAQRYAAYSGVDMEQFRLEITMMLGGTLVLWQRWVEGGFQEPPEVLAPILHRFIEDNTRRIWTREAK